MSAPSCYGDPGGSLAPADAHIVALVGAPNFGKSTLFNALTGARAQTGNWPGTTVEVSRGALRTEHATYDLIDFPGTYSLDPLSPDEELTRNMLIDCPACERPDVVIVVIDATAVARGLNVALQLAEHPYRLAIALTKTDVAAKQGVTVDAAMLADATSIPTFVINGRHRQGLDELRDYLQHAPCSEPVVLREDTSLETRFADLDAAAKACVHQVESKPSLSQRLDSVALHPVAGPLLFMAVMWVVFQITTTVAAPLQDGLEALVSGPLSDAARSVITQPLLQGLIVDGLIGGVGMVLTFAPLMALMFACLAFLEDSGYMARAAVVTDRVMRAIGLPGKAFIPIVVGFGCNVPAISATRVLGNRHHRIMTALLIPFASCSARLVVFVMLASTFFPEHAGSVVFAMYVISIALLVGVGLILRKTLWRAIPQEPLVIDLPTYQLPTARLTAAVTWTRLKGFLHTAGGIIVATVVAVWLLMAVPVGASSGMNPEPEDSAFGAISSTIAPVFAPAGFDSWSLTGPLLTGFVAKEALISTWAQTYAVDDVTDAEPDEQASSPLSEHVRADFEQASDGHPLAAVWAYMLFLLAYTPCVATLAAQRREISWRRTMFGFSIQLASAWVLAVAAFQILKVFL